MRILKLALHQFRNIAELAIELNPRFNIFVGPNAQGKTNILESIYLLSSLQSFKGSRNRELIGWDVDEAFVRGLVERDHVSYEVLITLTPAQKRVKIDGKSPKSSFDVFGLVNVVLFAPEDLRITKGEPDARRRFVDRAIFNADSGHLELVRNYQKVLRNRNNLLKQSPAERNLALLEVYDEQLGELGGQLMQRRASFLEELAPHFSRAFLEIVGEERELQLLYQTSGGISTASEALVGALVAARGRDLRRGSTSVGPHLDDLELLLEGRNTRAFASQGQHRALVLALKIGEIAYLREKLGFYPALMLDDVSSELDRQRNGQLMEYLKGFGGQVFITTTDLVHLGIDSDYQAFRVDAGTVSRTS
ncbi:MAG: DNA replication/repair protein RecF [Myxococcales bacterium]|nr:DNA replication/repair protein RecF [Myxococcales bacterium]